MPSPWHDALNALFEKRPEFAVEVLRDLLEVDLPSGMSATLEDPSFNTRPSQDFQADAVIAVGPKQSPYHSVIVEIQQDKEPAKRRQLPRYAATVWLQLNCPVHVLVVCPNQKVADYYADPISTELPGYIFQAKVLGPDYIPAIMDPQQVAAQPDLATVGIMAHGQDLKVAEAFFVGIKQLKREHTKQYDRYAKAIVPLSVQRFLEGIMKSSAELEPGFIETEAMRREAAKTLLMFLSARGLSVSDEDRKRITTEDLDQLETWVSRAATAETTDDLFR